MTTREVKDVLAELQALGLIRFLDGLSIDLAADHERRDIEIAEQAFDIEVIDDGATGEQA